MRRFVSVFCLALLGVIAPAHAQTTSGEQIVWQLKNPFRYFKDPEQTARHTRAVKSLGLGDAATPIAATERTLAKDTDGRGWASSAYAKVEDEACWYDHALNKQADRDCGDYVLPKSHAVLVQSPVTNGPCTWSIDGTTIAAADCRKLTEIQIPYPAGAAVTLTVGGNLVATLPIKVVDLLVVGLGDSFGSGEGNPDKPVSFMRGRTVDYAGSEYPRDEFAGFPQRDGLPLNADERNPAFARQGAGWVHRNCHRSLYAHQLRAALHLAVADPKQQQSVTFVGLACTGATILDLFNAYTGRAEPKVASDPAHAKQAHGMSALSTLSHALCKPGKAELADKNYNVDDRLKNGGDQIRLFNCPAADRLRNVDLLLLSIGGNDVGFSGLIANASLDDAYLGMAKLFGESPKIKPPIATSFLARLPGRYSALAEAIKDVTGITDTWRIVLTAYPKMGFDHEGNACRPGNAGMDLTRAWRMNTNAILATERFMEDEFMPVMRKAATDAGWSLATAHRDKHFDGHGLCAIAESEADEAAAHNKKLPRYATGDGRRSQWTPYRPADFRPYLSTQRWFRTPNDAFLAAHYHGGEKTISRGGRLLQLTSWSAFSGAFHPNAEGHAAMADAVVSTIKDKPLAAASP
jgi:lysophospholipase L1-like esterase